MRKEKGITLIALIITIIIMLILAGVVITLTIGENGLFKTAKYAAKNYTNAEAKELADLNNITNIVDQAINDETEKSAQTNPTLVSQITAKDYGKTINYSVTINETELSDWKVFYNDGTNVYIMLSNYLNNSLIPTSTGMKTKGSYAAYWESSSLSTPTNQSAIEILNNTTYWADFAKGRGGETATGGPTLDMYVLSWNEKGYTKLYTAKNSTGYFVGTNNTPTETYLMMSSDKAGYSDKLYYLSANYEGGAVCGYWLAAPCAKDSNRLFDVYHTGALNNSTIDGTVYGIRPVVCLSSEVTGNVGDTVAID